MAICIISVFDLSGPANGGPVSALMAKVFSWYTRYSADAVCVTRAVAVPESKTISMKPISRHDAVSRESSGKPGLFQIRSKWKNCPGPRLFAFSRIKK
jgi:hypothetical protein